MSTEPEAAPSQVEASKGSVLEMIEAAYPNPVTLDTMGRYTEIIKYRVFHYIHKDPGIIHSVFHYIWTQELGAYY